MEKWNLSVGKWNFERTENLREECQPSYVPQSPSGDFADVSILPRVGRRRLTGWDVRRRGEEDGEAWDAP